MTPRKYFSGKTQFLGLLCLGFFLAACKPSLLPSTNVKDTRENRAIVSFLERYKYAYEKRSVEGVMDLVALDFRDNMGSSNPADNLSYIALKDNLQKIFPRLQEANLALFVQRIVKAEKNIYEVYFYFNDQALADLPSGEKWFSAKDVNCMVLRKTGKKAPHDFEILSGI